MLEKYLIPDRIFNNIYEITPEFLTSRGIKAVALDIDNTLVTYDDPEPTERLLGWIDELHAAGITIGFISNNSKERVELFNRSLGYIAYPDAHKPLTGTMKHFLSETEFKKEEIAHVGDQIFTDVLGVDRYYTVTLMETLPKEATQEMITSGFDLSLYTCTPGGASRVTARCTAGLP